MTKRIRASEATLPPLRDRSVALPRLDANRVQEELGGEAVPAALTEALAPVTLFAVREELVKRLQSSGGRPALAGTTRRAKVPLSDEEWSQLEELAATLAAPGFAPSAGQVASVLLTLSLHAVASRLSPSLSGASHSPLARELALLAAAESNRES